MYDLGIQIRIHGREAPIVHFCTHVHKTCKDLSNIYTNTADTNEMLTILSWFSVTITSRLVTAIDACNIS